MHRSRTAILSALLLAASLVATWQSSATPAWAQTDQTMLVTLYGWPDNSPPGDVISYPTLHDVAGGTGTYDDPITFATDQNELPPGTIVYYPYLHRYFIMEDDCAECDSDWENNGIWHIDLWIGGQNAQDDNDVINCENALTQDSADVIIDPPSDEPVDTTPLFDSSTDTCYDPSSFGG